MRTPERVLKDQVLTRLKARGCYVFMPVQTGYGATTLDILACYCGKFLAIETKAPGKHPTPRQELVMREVRTADGVAFWCDSIGMFDSQMAIHFA